MPGDGHHDKKILFRMLVRVGSGVLAKRYIS